MTTTGRISIRKKPLMDALIPPPPIVVVRTPTYRRVAYSIVQEQFGGWQWKVLPVNGLHASDYQVATGFAASREAAECAVHRAIDAQLDC